MEYQEVKCRNCGSPMHVAEGAERIRCPYCGTEYILKSHNKQEISVHVINYGGRGALILCHSSGSAVSTILKGIKDMELTKEEKNASWKLITSDMAKICDRIYPQTTSALISVVQEIRKLNPDVQILLMGYTDPVPFIPCWHNYFRKLNKFEKQLAETYDLTYVAIPRAKTDLDVHPTIKGHEYIANKIVNAIDVKAE